MIFTMNNQSLLEGLSIVTRALAPRSSKQILEGVFLTAHEDRVTMVCSDGNFSITYTDEAAVPEEGTAVLPGRLFLELIRKMPAGDVKISVTDQRSATIRCMNNRSSVAVMNAAEYPEIPTVRGGVPVKIPQKKLKDMVSHALFAIATDENRAILTGSLLEVSANEARIVALDGFRLSLQKLNQPFENLPAEAVKAVIPGKFMAELSRILADDESFCSIMLDRGMVQCAFGNIMMSGSLLIGEFIDYRKIIPTEYKTEVKVDRRQLEESIERASLMAREGKNNLIRMSFRQEELTVTSNAEMGNVEEKISVALTGEELDIAFNARYIMDVVRNVSQDELIMRFNSSVSPCVIYPQSGDDYLYLILPVRVYR